MSRPIRADVFRAQVLHGKVWAWTCYSCDRADRNALTGEDFGLNAAFSWSDAMQMAGEHVDAHRRLAS